MTTEAPPGRRFLELSFAGNGGQMLLDIYPDGTATVATRSHPSETWSPPVPVTVTEGVDAGAVA